MSFIDLILFAAHLKTSAASHTVQQLEMGKTVRTVDGVLIYASGSMHIDGKVVFHLGHIRINSLIQAGTSCTFAIHENQISFIS